MGSPVFCLWELTALIVHSLRDAKPRSLSVLEWTSVAWENRKCTFLVVFSVVFRSPENAFPLSFSVSANARVSRCEVESSVLQCPYQSHLLHSHDIRQSTPLHSLSLSFIVLSMGRLTHSLRKRQTAEHRLVCSEAWHPPERSVRHFPTAAAYACLL